MSYGIPEVLCASREIRKGMTSGSEDDETRVFRGRKRLVYWEKKQTYLPLTAVALTAAVIYSPILMMNLEVQNDTHMGDSVNKLK